MSEKVLKIDSKYPGLVEKDWCFEFSGKIDFEGSILIELGTKWLFVTESIKAGAGIEAGWGIKAGAGIKAGWGIKAGAGIKAGEGIEAGAGIEAGEGIEAGWGIVSGLWIKCKKKLSCKFNIFAGTATYKKPSTEESVIECGEFEGSGEGHYSEMRILSGTEEN